MRTIKKITLVVLMFVTTLSYAEKRNNVILSKIAVVEFTNAKKGQQLIVKDEFGIILHSETITKNGNLSKTFDLKQLKDGNYTIELEKDFEILIKPFEIKNNRIAFLKDNDQTLFKPVMRTENNKLLVSLMSLESESVNIKIFYEDDLIYSEAFEGKKTINRIYKLQDRELGNYYAIVKSDNRTYIEYFKL